MAVLHDFMCKRHGVFESREAQPDCPMKGCEEEVYKVFLKPVGTRSAKTKATDHALEGMAQQLGFSDFSKTHEGEPQRNILEHKGVDTAQFEQATAAMAGQREGQKPYKWGGMGGYTMAGALGGGLARPIRDEPVGMTVAGTMPDVRSRTLARRDPDNLTLPSA